MRKSNYDITKEKMAIQFLEYDQERMIKKYGLEHDGTYLYLEFAGNPYRINRRTGQVERCRDDGQAVAEANYNEAMSIYDVLCYAKDDSHLSGMFCPASSLDGVVSTSSSQPGDSFFREERQYFDSRTDLLEKACKSLGGIPMGKGDVAYQLQVFPFLPVQFQFWNSDEDFDAEIQFLWDKNVLQYMHYETLWFVMGHIIGELKERIQDFF